MSYNIIIIHLNKVLQKFSTARPSSSVAKHKLLRDTKKQQDVITRLDVMTSCCFFVSLSSLCFATDEDGRAVENFCNTLFKCINYNLHEEMFCFNV